MADATGLVDQWAMVSKGRRPQNHQTKCPDKEERRGRGLFPMGFLREETFQTWRCKYPGATLGDRIFMLH